jgi:hypothetical protein
MSKKTVVKRKGHHRFGDKKELSKPYGCRETPVDMYRGK